MNSRSAQQLDLTGAVTFATHTALRDNAVVLLRRGDVVIDWAGVDTVDSSALSLIFSCQRSARAAEHRVEHHNLPQALLALAELYGVSHLVFGE